VSAESHIYEPFIKFTQTTACCLVSDPVVATLQLTASRVAFHRFMAVVRFSNPLTFQRIPLCRIPQSLNPPIRRPTRHRRQTAVCTILTRSIAAGFSKATVHAGAVNQHQVSQQCSITTSFTPNISYLQSVFSFLCPPRLTATSHPNNASLLSSCLTGRGVPLSLAPPGPPSAVRVSLHRLVLHLACR
jgi:hypothetical protein